MTTKARKTAAAEPADRTGYEVVEQPPPGGIGQTTYRVTREADGVGIGAYHDDTSIDLAISLDREALKASK